MKKYNMIIAASVVVYLILALLGVTSSYRINAAESRAYKVEINRIYESLSETTAPDRLHLDSYEYIQEILFLPISEQKEKKILDFYTVNNEEHIEIKPWYRDGELLGYVKFVYKEDAADKGRLLIWSEVGLLIMEVFILLVLFYLRARIIRPFNRVSELPYELSKGNLGGMIKEEKNRYFGKFIWGIGQLRDSLEVSKKRSLELEKEKKQLLLSLSHDIKTPLNTIKLYGKALEEELYKKEEEKHNAARQIGQKVEEIERFVEEIMKTSREDMLEIEVKDEVFYLADLMKKVLDTYEEKCAIRLLSLHVTAYENRLLKGDIERAREVCENIFENAFKYGDGKEIDVSFHEEDYCQLIRICNTGIPATETEFNHIFESFFRGGNSEGKQGNGLGLYISREIMRKMGGEIFAEILEDGMAFVLVFL